MHVADGSGSLTLQEAMYPLCPSRHLLRDILTLQLGATVALSTSPEVTHVVSGSTQTDKVHWAREQGRHLVSPGWLHAAGLPFGCHPCMVSAYVQERMAHGTCCKVCTW